MNIGKFIRRILLLGIFLGVLLSAAIARAEEVPYWKVIMAEAVSEGYDGMYAVACVIRNRGGTNGLYGGKRKDLDTFCKKQGKYYISLAKIIERRVFEEKAPDTTAGATHFENVQLFGVPYWAKDMLVTRKIGRHTFFKER